METHPIDIYIFEVSIYKMMILLFEILNKTQGMKNPFEIPVIQRDSHGL